MATLRPREEEGTLAPISMIVPAAEAPQTDSRRAPVAMLAAMGSLRNVMSPWLMAAAVILMFTYPGGGVNGDWTSRSSRARFSVTQRAFMLSLLSELTVSCLA